jgi:hypothetical protein
MSFFDIFCYFLIAIVAFLIIKSVIPWIYENFLGPAIFGGSIKFKDFGKWARKFSSDFIELSTDFFVRSYSCDWCWKRGRKGIQFTSKFQFFYLLLIIFSNCWK